MFAKQILLSTALLLGAAGAGRAQSQTGGNFGTVPSGSAASRSNGGSSYGHSRHRDSIDGEQNARRSGGSGESGR